MMNLNKYLNEAFKIKSNITILPKLEDRNLMNDLRISDDYALEMYELFLDNKHSLRMMITRINYIMVSIEKMYCLLMVLAYILIENNKNADNIFLFDTPEYDGKYSPTAFNDFTTQNLQLRSDLNVLQLIQKDLKQYKETYNNLYIPIYDMVKKYYDNGEKLNIQYMLNYFDDLKF